MGSADRPAVTAAKAVRHDLGLGPGDAADPFAMADLLGVSVVRVPLGEHHPVDGAYLRRQGRGFILVNSSMPGRRRRLTCAHELGHHVLIEDASEVEVIESEDRITSKTDPDERAAYRFAAELLMPEAGVRAAAAGLNPEDAMGAVCRVYGASPDAAAIRLAEVDLLDAAACGHLRREIKEDWRAIWARQRIPKDDREEPASLPPRFVELAHLLRERGVIGDERLGELVERGVPGARGT